MTQTNPFAPQAAAQPAASTNPFAAQPPVPAPPAPTPGVQAIAAAFAAQPATPNPFAVPLVPAQPTAAFPAPAGAPVVQVQTSPIPSVAQATAYPPLNPPGERVTALGDAGTPAAPAPVPVQPPTPPAPAEPRRRTRKHRTVEVVAQGQVDVITSDLVDAGTDAPAAAQFTTEQIVELLIERGYTVALKREPA